MVPLIGVQYGIPDGYGVMFDPVKHARYVRYGLAQYAAESSQPKPPPPEPVWKDHPAGRSKCPVLHEDHEQGKGHYA